MAETDATASAYQSQTGVTASTLRKTLIDVLGATHVDIEDMSGTSPPPKKKIKHFSFPLPPHSA